MIRKNRKILSVFPIQNPAFQHPQTCSVFLQRADLDPRAKYKQPIGCRTVVQSVSLTSFFPKQCIPPLIPSSERKHYNLILLMNVFNKSHFHGKPSTASNGCTHTLRKKSKVNRLVYQGDGLCSSALSQHFIFVILRRGEKKSIFSKGGESESPALQIPPLGTVLLKPQMHHCNYQPVVEMGVCCEPGQKKTADNHCSTRGRRAAFYDSLGDIN